MLQNKRKLECWYSHNHPTLYLFTNANCNPQLNCHPVPLPSPCVLRFLIALQRKICGEQHWRFPQYLRVVLSIYEPAWDLVNKCLRNTFTQQLPTCFPPFPLTFPHISRRVAYVSSGISYVSPNFSLYFLF